MKKLDRIILIILVLGVWGLLGTIWLKPSNVDAEDIFTDDIFMFDDQLKKIVQGCTVLPHDHRYGSIGFIECL